PVVCAGAVTAFCTGGVVDLGLACVGAGAGCAAAFVVVCGAVVFGGVDGGLVDVSDLVAGAAVFVLAGAIFVAGDLVLATGAVVDGLGDFCTLAAACVASAESDD